MELIDIVAGGFSCRPVDGDAVPHLILNDQHPQLLQLLAQLLDVIADDAVVNVHIGTVVEHVQTAGNVDFQRRGDELGLLFLLRPESIVQILQDGHILRPGVGEVFLIHQPHTAVNHCFLHRLEAVFTAHNNVAEGQQEIHLQGQRAFIIRIVQVEVHRIDILLAGGGNLYNLSVQPLDKGVILGLRVCNQNVIVRDEEHIQNLPLGGEGFAAPRSAED